MLLSQVTSVPAPARDCHMQSPLPHSPICDLILAHAIVCPYVLYHCSSRLGKDRYDSELIRTLDEARQSLGPLIHLLPR
jgi:hypothetical protein